MKKNQLIGMLCLTLAASPCFAQQSAEEFYGSPAPSDFPQMDGQPVDDNAAAMVESPSNDSGGVFEKKPYTLSAALREGFDDNLFTTETNRSSSFYTNLAAGAEYKLENSRLQLSAALNGGVTYYYTRPGTKNDFTGALDLQGSYKANQRLTLNFSTSTAYLAQPDLEVAGTSARNNGDYMYSSTTIAGSYQWAEKFSTDTKYNFTPYLYVDNSLNNEQGRIEQTLGQSFRWLVLPKTTAVAEYRANPVNYYSAPLDSFGQFFLLGADQVFSPKFKVTGRGGAELRFYTSDNDNPDYFGPFAELNGMYEYQKLSSLGLNMRYGTEASGLNGAATRNTFRIGLNVVQGLTPKLSFNAGFNYLNNYYNQFDKQNPSPSFYENIVEFSLGANFKINKNIVLQGGYTRTVDAAPASEQLSYSRNVTFVGVNVVF
ncbi:MAG: hypothetical protein WCG66_08040 [bacterium]